MVKPYHPQWVCARNIAGASLLICASISGLERIHGLMLMLPILACGQDQPPSHFLPILPSNYPIHSPLSSLWNPIALQRTSVALLATLVVSQSTLQCFMVAWTNWTCVPPVQTKLPLKARSEYLLINSRPSGYPIPAPYLPVYQLNWSSKRPDPLSWIVWSGWKKHFNLVMKKNSHSAFSPQKMTS